MTNKKFDNIKYFIGPMSENVVNSVIEFTAQENIEIGFIPSRRQVDYNGGYVNNWNTQEFSKYVRSKSSKIVICRDHGGENQGQIIELLLCLVQGLILTSLQIYLIYFALLIMQTIVYFV